MLKNENKRTILNCTKCGAIVEENDMKCPKCKNLLANEGATKSKLVSKEKYDEILEKERPSFKLEKWYQYPFYILGWFGVLNLAFWISLLWVNSRNTRYDKFWNPATDKAVYIWGMLYAISITLSIIFWSLI